MADQLGRWMPQAVVRATRRALWMLGEVLLVDHTRLRRVSPRAAQPSVRIREVTGSIEPV